MANNKRITYKDLDSKSSKERNDQELGQRWWNAPKGQAVAGRVINLASQLELANWSSNYLMQYVCNRLMTNRSTPYGYGFSMVRRVGRAAQSMVSATWTPPTINVVALAADVFMNKVFKSKPWIQYLPTVKGSYKSRSKCKAMTQFVDAAFHELEVWDKASLAAIDCMTYPSGFIKVGRGVDNKLSVERVLAAELLLTPEQSGSWASLRSCLQRVFIPKSDLVAAFVTGNSPDDKATLQAIRNAPGVYPGFYTSNAVDYQEIAALVEGWSLPLPDGTPGRHVLCIDNYTLVDEPWTRKKLPFAKLDFVRLSNEYMGQSLAEIQLPLQRYIDRLCAAIDEIEQRWSFPRYFVENSSHVDTDQFGSDFVEYSGTKPEKDATNSVPTELYTSRDKAIEMAMQRVGVSQQSAGGEKPEGLSSGLAIMAWSQVDDSRHIDLAQRYEQFMVDISDLILDECSELNPKFIVEGRQALKWSDVAMDRDEYTVSAFPMSRLPQQPSARFEMIARWYQDGTISRADKLRLENMPDIQPVIDAGTASADWVENALDEIVEIGKYRPPLPFLDVRSAKTAAQARFIREDTLGLEDSRLRVINRFLSALNQMSPQTAPAQMMPGQTAPQPMPGPQPISPPGQGQPAPQGQAAPNQATGSGQVGQA